jgi:hypothetical protein
MGQDLDGPEWMSPGDAGRTVGMGSQWVRRQIEAGRLQATAWTVGGRVTYRIRVDDWEAFRARFSRSAEELRSERDGA